MSERFDPNSLRKVRGLTALAYTGVIFVLPPMLAARFWLKVAEVGDHIITTSLAAWTGEIEELAEELVEQVVA